MLCRQPDKTRTKVRPILIEVSSEECCHEQRHYGHRPAKMRQFGLQPQIRLIVTIAVDCQICSLYSHHHTDLCGYALFIGESLTEHDRLTGEQNGRSLRIHRFVHTADAISCGVDSVVDDTPTDALMSSARGYPSPAKSRVGLAAWFVFGRQPLGRTQVHTTQHEFARAERQNHSDDNAERSCRCSRGEPPSTPTCNERYPRAQDCHRQSSGRLEYHVPMARQEKRRYEVPVEKPLIRDECAR